MKGNSRAKVNNRLIPVIILIVIAVFTSFTIISCGNGDKTADKDAAAAVSEQTIEKKTEEKNDESSKKEETTKETTAKETSAKSNESTKKDSQTAKAATKSTQAAKVCYISIEGYCSNKKVNLQSGDSVYDILERSGAKVSARNTGYGIYVEGINGRFEFDEGATSGWMYYVNGSAPNKSCGEYKVSSGDKITWDYVSEL